MMRRLIDLKILVLFVGLSSCMKLKPEAISIPEYPDFEELISQQVELLGNSRIKKEVSLSGQREVKMMEMDSTKWADELSFLKEINPNQPEYIGAFVMSGDELNQTLTLREGEKGAVKKVSFSKTDDGFEKISASFHEDKDVYVHHREIEMNFEEGKLLSMQIDGYQKMMFKDTVRFEVDINVQQP